MAGKVAGGIERDGRNIMKTTKWMESGGSRHPIVINKDKDKLKDLGESINLAMNKSKELDTFSVHSVGKEELPLLRLKKSKDEWVNTFDAITDVTTIHDEEFRIVRANKAFFEKFNVDKKQLSTKKCYEVCHGTDKPWHNCPLEKCKKSLKPECEEVNDSNMGGTFLISTYPILDEKGVFHGAVQQVRDITERKKTEEVIRKAKEFSEKLIETAHDAIVCIDEDGRVKVWNNSAEKVFGYSRNEIMGQPITNLAPEKYRKKHLEDFKRFLQTDQTKIIGKKIEASGKTKEGKEIPIELSLSFYETENKELTFIGIVRDLTERKRIEDILLRSEKMKSMGMITSGVAHEFNNILAIVKGFSLQIKKKCVDDKELEKRVDTIIKASNDGVEIVRRMREYTNIERDSTSFVLTDMRDLIKQAIEFTMPRWQNIAHANGINYKIDTDGFREVLCVMGNQSELREVLVNIINNALDAMPDGGSLSFRIWGKENTVFVSISDTGVGMKKNVQKDIFDPFFTTKVGVGTGLGMSTAYGIITRHGGKIEVESEEGKGSTFTIRLPVSEETVRSEVTFEPEPEIKAEGLRILIVDDKQDICDLLSEYFLEDGHNVKSVNSGAMAIKLLETEIFDLVLSDLVMPKVSGYDIIKAVGTLEMKPKVGIITGWANTDRTGKEEALKADFIITKPIIFSELTHCINNIFSKYSSYDIGIAEIDIQHANLDLLLSKLSEEGLSQNVKAENIELFRNTISSHFDFEEKWTQTNNKIFDSDHLRAHNEFLELLNEMNTQYKNKQLNMNTISLTIKKELLNHVRNHDIRLNI